MDKEDGGEIPPEEMAKDRTADHGAQLAKFEAHLPQKLIELSWDIYFVLCNMDICHGVSSIRNM